MGIVTTCGWLPGELHCGIGLCTHDKMPIYQTEKRSEVNSLKVARRIRKKCFAAAVRKADDWIKAQTAEASGFL